MNLTNDNFSSNSKHKTINIMSSVKKKNIISNNESNISNSKSSKNLLGTPNFSDTGKTPKRPHNNNSNHKIKPFSNNDSNEKNNSNSINYNNYEDNTQYKILVKKRPKNDIPIPSGGIKKRNSSSISLSKNLSKIVGNNFEICKIKSINYTPDEIEKGKEKDIKNEENKNKFIFNDENEIIDYIFNKFEEERKKKNYFNRKLRFTGFVLSKKYKGKNLCDIRIEDDIAKINQQLKEENVRISEREIEFKFLDDEKENTSKDNNSEANIANINNNELIEENKKLKLENEKLNKKDMVKNELIKKLDNDKTNFIEEIEKLKNEIEELKKKNNNLIEERNTINNKENNKINLEIENNILFDIYRAREENKSNVKNQELNDKISTKNTYELNNHKDIDKANSNSNDLDICNYEDKNKKGKKIIIIKDILGDNNLNKKQNEDIYNKDNKYYEFQGNEKNNSISINENKEDKEIYNEIINPNEIKQMSNCNENNSINKEEAIDENKN